MAAPHFLCASTGGQILAVLLTAVLALAACVPASPPAWEIPAGLPAPTAEAPADKPVVAEAAAPAMKPPKPPDRRETVVVQGSGRFARPQPMIEARATEAGDITFSFVDADVRQVAKAVLGDILGRRYVVSPRIQGTVTVQTTQPLSPDAAFATLETALRLNGIALVEADGVVKVVPYEDAPKVGGSPRVLPGPSERPPGYGVEIVPLAFVSAGEMRRILDPIVPPGAVLQADEARNILIFSGTRQELQTMRETIEIFDVDWLKGMSFALIPLQHSDAKVVANELSTVFGEAGAGPLRNVMRFVPVERLNSLLVIATNPDYLADARRWVENFDRPGDAAGGGRRLYVYQVQNGRANDVAAVLDGLFTTRVPSGVVTAPTGQKGAGDPGAIVPIFERGARVVADPANNALIVLATPEEFQTVEQAMRKLDVVPLQVLVEATIAEVTLNDNLRYGLQWFFQQGKVSATFSTLNTGAVNGVFPGFSFALQGTDARVILNALSEITTINVVSAPTLMVLGNQTAVLQVGDQVPVAVQQAVSVTDATAPIVNSIQFRDTGVILKVTPRVNAGGLIYLDIEQEVSDVVQTNTSNIDSPTIRQRRISSTVAVQSGETVALGGLIRDSRTNGKTGVPVLSDIPILGALFGVRTDDTARTELLVLLSPKVVRSRDDARGLTDELRRRLKGLSPPPAAGGQS